MCLCVCVCVGFSLCVHGCVFSCRHLLCLCMCVCLYLCVRVCVLLLHTRSVFVLFTFLCGVATLFISVSLFLFNDKSPIFFEHHWIREWHSSSAHLLTHSYPDTSIGHFVEIVFHRLFFSVFPHIFHCYDNLFLRLVNKRLVTSIDCVWTLFEWRRGYPVTSLNNELDTSVENSVDLVWYRYSSSLIQRTISFSGMHKQATIDSHWSHSDAVWWKKRRSRHVYVKLDVSFEPLSR